MSVGASHSTELCDTDAETKSNNWQPEESPDEGIIVHINPDGTLSNFLLTFQNPVNIPLPTPDTSNTKEEAEVQFIQVDNSNETADVDMEVGDIVNQDNLPALASNSSLSEHKYTVENQDIEVLKNKYEPSNHKNRSPSVLINPDGTLTIQNPVTILLPTPDTSNTKVEAEVQLIQVDNSNETADVDMDVGDIVNQDDLPALASNSSLSEHNYTIENQDIEVSGEPFCNDADSLDAPINQIILVTEESIQFEWHENFNTFESVPEVFTGPTPGPIKTYDNIYNAFKDIWDEAIIEQIVNATNKYAEETKKVAEEGEAEGMAKSSRMLKWCDTNVHEMYLYLAMHMLITLAPLTPLSEYWRTGILEMPGLRQVMTFSRFVLLNKFLRFDDSSTSKSFQHTEMLSLMSHLETKFRNLYNLERDIAIRHSLTLYNGRLLRAEAKRSKAARFGIKFLELLESKTGYIYKFYENSTACDNVSHTNVALALLKDLFYRGHCVTVNNCNFSPFMARFLKKLGFDCFGAIDANDENIPRDIKDALNRQPGALIARHSGDVSCIASKRAQKTIVSTYHTAITYSDKLAENTAKIDPKCQSDERKKSFQWHTSFFRRLLNISIDNAFILLSSSPRNIPQLRQLREIRYELAHKLTEFHRPSLPTVLISQSIDVAVRLRRDLRHTPLYLSKRKRCHICFKNDKTTMTHLKCKDCNEFFCGGDCWEQWHYETVLTGREVETRKTCRTS